MGNDQSVRLHGLVRATVVTWVNAFHFKLAHGPSYGGCLFFTTWTRDVDAVDGGRSIGRLPRSALGGTRRLSSGQQPPFVDVALDDDQLSLVVKRWLLCQTNN
ncbi:unnamed protein product [Soboliphyme baturini]|uniref:Uncharacterized protein n=1 Tax=Soboliphyme baturini TaxID=241478 RepID=A0A183IKP2_9BILA|nr:unnamed protein product [Soboliphyme baturini]